MYNLREKMKEVENFMINLEDFIALEKQKDSEKKLEEEKEL